MNKLDIARLARPAALLLSLLAGGPALADVTVGLGIELSGDAAVKTTTYTCEGHDPLVVRYIDAAPNFLAIIPIDGKPLVFVNTISASGAKYEAGQYIWWNKGSDATLSDVTEGLDAAPVLTCAESVDTP